MPRQQEDLLVSIEGRRDFLLVKDKTHAAIAAGILDWRKPRTLDFRVSEKGGVGVYA